MATRAVPSLLLVACAGASLAAQVPVQVGIRVEGTGVRARGVSPTLATGTLAGGQGSLTFGVLRLSLLYHEGLLRDGSIQPRLVEGGAAADLQLLSWLSAGVGGGARAYTLDSTIERRFWLAGRVGVDVPLIGSSVRTDVRLWRSVVGSARDAELTYVRGGEVGIAYWAPTRWWIRLATTFDDAAFVPGRHERLTGLVLGAGFGP